VPKTSKVILELIVDSLHKSLVDSQLGFKECSTIATNDSWKQKFESFATEREQMMRDLEICGGASKSSSGTMAGGLSRAWSDIKASLSGGGQNIIDSIWKEEMNLKKTYDDAIKSHGIASSLNGLLVQHIRKIDNDLNELRSLFGDEGKHLSTEQEAAWNTEQQPSTQRRQSIGDKIKSALGFTTDPHDKAIERQKVYQQQLSGRGFV